MTLVYVAVLNQLLDRIKRETSTNYVFVVNSNQKNNSRDRLSQYLV
jgi:hypothetical protein